MVFERPTNCFCWNNNKLLVTYLSVAHTPLPQTVLSNISTMMTLWSFIWNGMTHNITSNIHIFKYLHSCTKCLFQHKHLNKSYKIINCVVNFIYLITLGVVKYSVWMLKNLTENTANDRDAIIYVFKIKSILSTVRSSLNFKWNTVHLQFEKQNRGH